MTAGAMPGRLQGFGEWGQDRLRRHLDLLPFAPAAPDPKMLPPGWDCLIEDEKRRFADGFWCAEEEGAFLLGSTWRYSQGIDRHFYPLTANGGVLFPEPHWAQMLKGRSFIVDVEPATGNCEIDTSAYPPLGHFDEPVLYVGGSPNWGHWMADILGRLMCLDFFPELQNYRLAFGGLTQVQTESLDLLGIKDDKRLALNLPGQGFGAYSFKSLAVPSSLPLSMVYPWLYEKLVRNLHKNCGGKDGPELVYLTRRGFFPAHRVYNQDEVEGLAESRGFEIIAAEEYSLSDLIRKMAKAKIVISPIGAGLGNFLLAPPDAILIHLMPDILQNGFDKSIIFVNWMRYYYPLRDRLVLVFGDFRSSGQEAFAKQYGISGHDIPAR